MAELHVSRRNIQELLSGRNVSGKTFVIPEYQRPYKWDIDKCETLWNDIVDFHTSQRDCNINEYFLGTIVTCENTDGNLEVIDGQQRLTSFLLLLRSFYSSLVSANNINQTDAIRNLMNKIAPCIWRNVDSLDGTVRDRNKVRLISSVATENDNRELLDILSEGIFEEESKSLYAINYKFFNECCKNYAKENPTDWYHLCLSIIEKCIILPIECNDLASALTIFSTLNDRGMPLSDADIFKAHIFKEKGSKELKDTFVEQWKELADITEGTDLSINDIFRYYTHILRAKNKITDKEIALRRFYMDNKGEKLTNDIGLMDNLINLAKFWRDVNNGGESPFFNESCRKWIQCLRYYPNDFWKYILSVFAYKNLFPVIDERSNNKEIKEAQKKLELFLRHVSAFLYSKFIMKPTASAIKDDIFKNCVHIMNDRLSLITKNPEKEDYEFMAQSKITRGLLLLNVYLFDDEQKILNDGFEVEHIFPKKWQNTNYNGWNREDADTYLERLGNKIIFEKKLNIQAGNGYFNNKKDKYKNSDVQEVVKCLANSNKEDWVKEDIEKREDEVIERINVFFAEYRE